VSVPEDQFEEAKAVAEDLAYLADEWKPRLEPAELRRLSPVLRRLLVEGAYGRAWRSVGLQGEPSVSATDLDAMLGALDRSIIHTAFAPPGLTVGRSLAAGGKLHIEVLEGVPPHSVLVAVIGDQDGRGLGPMIAVFPPEKQNRVAADPEEAAADTVREGLGRRVAHGMGLTEFLRSPAALVTGVEISRQDVTRTWRTSWGACTSTANAMGRPANG
jgi:hypothetical protein